MVASSPDLLTLLMDLRPLAVLFLCWFALFVLLAYLFILFIGAVKAVKYVALRLFDTDWSAEGPPTALLIGVGGLVLCLGLYVFLATLLGTAVLLGLPVAAPPGVP